LKEGINEFKYDVKKENSESKEGIRLGLNEVQNDARKEASTGLERSCELQEMMRQMMTNNNNNNNNSTSQRVANSAKKRKHDAKTTSINLEDEDMTSPEHRKQR
jgi:hypothetical protein